MKTRTGNFSIGFRLRGWTSKVDFETVITWTKASGLGGMDIGDDADRTAGQVIEAGLWIGSVDARDWAGLISPDKGRRRAAIAENTEYIQACAAHGPMNHFLVMRPENPDLPRAENFGYMVESFGELAAVYEANDARIVIEGWPGPGALCCTPEGLRAFLEEVPSKAMGVNFDPSHLLRMGIDPIRFLNEFLDRVYHVHGKDTEILADRVYEYGTEQPATFAKPTPFGAYAWRYCIPGHGLTSWGEVFRILEANGYQGRVSIELEDANFNDGGDEEKFGILQAAQFLTGC